MIERIVLVSAVLAVSALVYWWYSRREGRVTSVSDAPHLTSQDLGTALGFHASLVQFSSPMCTKCPPTAQLLSRIADGDPRIVHLEIDATEHLDLARRFDIMRTPTTLVLDGTGSVVARMSGTHHEPQVREALDQVPPSGTEYAI